MEAIEALDPEHLCTAYWAGKHEREAAAAGLPLPSRAGAGRPAGAPRRRGGKRNRWARKVAACSFHCSWLWSLFENLKQPDLDFLRLLLQVALSDTVRDMQDPPRQNSYAVGQMHLGTVRAIAMSYAPCRKNGSDSDTEEDEEHSEEGAGNRHASHPLQQLM